MKVPRLGDQEMAIFTFISDHAPVSVREVADHFERERGLARTTVSTMMERLRKKGLLTRHQQDGTFRYVLKFAKDRLLKQKIGEFVQRTLGGSAGPLLQYFAESSNLKPEELVQLHALVAKLEGDGK